MSQALIPEFLSGSIGFNVHRTALLFRRELIRALSEFGLTPEQWHMLAVLAQAGHPLPQRTLVDELLRDKPTVSRVVQRMERKGWVKRSSDQADARVTLISLTPSGEKIASAAPGLIRDHFDRRLNGISAAAERRIVGDLRRLQEALEAELRIGSTV